MEKVNFIDFRWGDNDFAYPVKRAIELLWEEYSSSLSQKEEEDLKAAACKVAAGIHAAVRILNDTDRRLREPDRFKYLMEHMRVRKMRYAPDEDCDSGAVVVCVHDGEIWFH
jgi:hypothetical protein